MIPREAMDILSEAAQAIEPMWPITSLPEAVSKLFEAFHATQIDLQAAQNEVARLATDNLRLKSAIIEHREWTKDLDCLKGLPKMIRWLLMHSNEPRNVRAASCGYCNTEVILSV